MANRNVLFFSEIINAIVNLNLKNFTLLCTNFENGKMINFSKSENK